MKSFKKFVAEVAQPKPEEEKRFKDQHTYEVIKHPVATDAQFTGDIGKPKAKRIADQEGEGNYDKAVKNPERRMAAESVNEEAEQIDEISKELASRYLKRAPARAADAGEKHARASDAYDKEQGKKDRKKSIRKFLNTQRGVERATNRLMKKESNADDRARYDAADDKNKKKVTLPKAPWEKKEEAAQIDEISKKLAGRYINKANIDTATAADRTARGHEDGRSNDKDIRAQGKANVKKGINTFIKRNQGTKTAVDKLTGKARVPAKEELSDKQKKIDHNKNGKIDGHDLAMLRKKKNEEVALDETTSSALKRPVTQTGPDGKTRTVMKKAKMDKTDDHGQDQITTKESVEMIDEAMKMKRGPMRLKDGSQIMVSKEDADLLNRMFKDLSSNNQRQMQKVMMMDKAGYEEIRGFAREAL